VDEKQKTDQAISGINEFLKNFKEKDSFTKIFLEIILEQLSKNKKKENEKKS
jgi:hypothetical protein